MARAAYDTTGLPYGLRTQGRPYPPRKAELYPRIVKEKSFRPPSFVRQEANVHEKEVDVQEGDPKPDKQEKA